MLNSDNISKEINLLISKFKDEIKLNILLSHIASLISEMINHNFDVKGRWDGNASNIDLFSGGSQKWKELSSSTISEYSKSKLGITPILYRTGNLKRNIEVGNTNNQIYISSNAPYSIYNQFGTKKMPARPFITLTEEDLNEIYDLIKSYLKL